MTIASDARNLIRDFPRYFETVYQAPLKSTLRLDHPLTADIDIVNRGTNAPLAAAGDYVIDHRNGLVRLADPSLYEEGVTVGGYFYEWFLPADLEFHARFVVQEHLLGRNIAAADFTPVELNVIAMGTVCQAFWSLLTQFATEIDVSDPEGIMIPAHQRFQQVQQLHAVWEKKYVSGAMALNVGFDRTMVSEVRRVSRMTGRLVPVFENQEVDDPRHPLRSLPIIEPKFTNTYEEGSYLGAEVGGRPI